MLELHNVTMEPSSVRKKSKGTTQCDKRIVICNVGTAQCENETVKCEKKSNGTTKCEDGTVKCEKKVREPPNVRKELSHVMLELHNMRMKPSSVKKK